MLILSVTAVCLCVLGLLALFRKNKTPALCVIVAAAGFSLADSVIRSDAWGIVLSVALLVFWVIYLGITALLRRTEQ